MKIPRSHLVRSRIVGLPFTPANRRYIDALTKLEHYVEHGPRSFAEGMSFHQLAETYPHELRALRFEKRQTQTAAAAKTFDRDVWLLLGGIDATGEFDDA